MVGSLSSLAEGFECLVCPAGRAFHFPTCRRNWQGKEDEMIAQHQAAARNNRSAKQFFFTNVPAPETVVDLARGRGWGVKGKRGKQTLFCLKGAVWVTQEGDIRDYLLEEGDAFLVTLPGLVLVRALTPARIGYAEDFMPGPFKGRFSQTVFH